jgi:hypothetical protein
MLYMKVESLDMLVIRADARVGCALVLLIAANLGHAQIQTTQEPSEPGPPRLGGLKTGSYGLSVGPGGGLEMQVKRNGNVQTLPPLVADAPMPAADPRNFEGSWAGDQYLDAWEIKSDMYGNFVPFNATGRKIMDMRLLANDQQRTYITPSIVCRSSGPVRDLIRARFQVFHSKDKIDILSAVNRTAWQIAMNPAIAEPAGTKSYSGRSIGHWDADTLVVETTGFKYRLYLSFRGTPLSTGGKLTTRIRKVHEDRWFLEMVTRVDDPVFYTRPWSFVRTFSWRPDDALFGEYNCEQQIGDRTNNPAAGFTREPDGY